MPVRFELSSDGSKGANASEHDLVISVPLDTIKVQLTGLVLDRRASHREVAWADLRPPIDGRTRSEAVECLALSTTDEEAGLIRVLLRSAPDKGFSYRAQCRVSHRPECHSKVRLRKGLFGDRGRRLGAETIELEVSATQVALVGVWPLDDLTIAHSIEGCFDHSTCCFILSTEPIEVGTLLSSLKKSLVSNGTCSINYPDLVQAVCPLGWLIMKADPRHRQNIVILGKRGTIQCLRDWLEQMEYEARMRLVPGRGQDDDTLMRR